MIQKILEDLLLKNIFFQLLAVGLSFLGGWLTVRYLRKFSLKNAPLIFYLVTFLFQAATLSLFLYAFSLPIFLIQIALLTEAAFVILSGVNYYLKKRSAKVYAALSIWLLFFLQVFGVLEPALNFLKTISIKIGPNSFSLLGLLKGLVATSLFVWGATVLSHYIERKLETHKHLKLSIQLLLGKVIKTILISMALYLGLSIFGIDLSMFAFFAGAVGVGIAFGLQNILSNFFCGFILLMDRSVKPGDVVSLTDGKIVGVVQKLTARYISIRTREGKEHLIPNQQVVSEKLENWSYSDTLIRMEIPFKVSYDSDLKLVEKLLVEIAKSTKRVLTTPAPYIRFHALNENAVELKLRLWLNDPQNGTSGIQSDIVYNAWKAFRENGIKVPVPAWSIYENSKEEMPIS